MPSTSGMKPGGFYDQNSSGQRSSIELLMPWLDEAVARVPLPELARPITIVDYGCSEGRNSLEVLSRACDGVRRRGAANAVVPVFSDLATNNFNQVFRNLGAAGRLAGGAEPWYPLAAGGSFYGPLLPPASVHLATTFNAVCWLDRLPAPLADFVICPPPWQHRAEVRVSAETRAAYAAQARADLIRFFTCRAAELTPGARLLIAAPGRDNDSWTGGGIYDLLHDACLDLVKAGRIDRGAFERFVMPVYFRSLDELLEPLSADESLRGAFAAEKSACQRVPTDFVAEYQRSGDLERYVECYVGFLQAFSEPVLRGALDSHDGADVVGDVYLRAKQRLRAAPQDYEFDYLQVAALLVRR